MKFIPPDQQSRLTAIGNMDNLEPELKKAFKPGQDFFPMGRPGEDDWLANHQEKGQTFSDFLASNPIKPDQTRKYIYLQPLNNFENRKDLLPLLQDYAALFFCMEIKLLPTVSVSQWNIRTRINKYTKNQQLHGSDILKLLQKKLPDDAFCMLAITMEDLYPDEEWNFVFGLASLTNRVGVFSFARYEPQFEGEKKNKKETSLFLSRCTHVLAHETGHMFGLQHCIYYRCLMNGSNHLEETDNRPGYLCPVCLRKLQNSVGFDIIQRYTKLYPFDKENKLKPEALWISKRLNSIIGKEQAEAVLNSSK